ncbi:unnamed protein product [Thlaspi arvense]|uniref:GDSL esterase/lipase n=1 Tax=Thlaspi arvense TaxID=13288 RepID=A0AAU9SWI3_THLAR|nr:unnamed protein product [Thlaspi arvense]
MVPKLFVFGDSYADTGNMKPDAESWISPYGITFPGKPSGRYSDGLTSTDFLETPYQWRTHGRKKLRLDRGMNFASGGSGVFTADPFPNLTAQVNSMADLLLARRVYTPEDIYPSDVSFISYAGGDYFDFILQNRPAADLKAFIEKVVDDLYVRIILMGGLLFKKIAITSLQPIGCSPFFTSASSYKSCNEPYSELVKVHNNSLKKVVAKLNENSRLKKKGQHYFIIDRDHFEEQR